MNFPDKEHLESSHHQYPIPDHGLKKKYNSTSHQVILDISQIICMNAYLKLNVLGDVKKRERLQRKEEDKTRKLYETQVK